MAAQLNSSLVQSYSLTDYGKEEYSFLFSFNSSKMLIFCINIFFSVAMTKTLNQDLKQWQPTPIVSFLSLESVRIVSHYKVHKRPKTVVTFETSFLLAKPNGYPTFHGRQFSMDTFLQCDCVS